MPENEVIIGYKATDKGLTCRGMQYVVGETYEHEGNISLCNSGFHFCQNPLDVLDFYNLCDSDFLTVEAQGQCESDDKKTVTNKLKVTASIGLPGLIKASVEWIFNHTEKSKKKDSSQLAASGYSSQLAASGDSSKLAASGDSSQLAASGDYSIAAGIGIDNQAKATIGSWIVLAEWSYNKKLNRWIPVCVLSAQVDGEKLKADTYYKVIDGKFVEA